MTSTKSAERYGDLEDGLGFKTQAFSDARVRRGFIRKVYGILMCQLAVTFAFILLFISSESVKGFSQAHPEMYIIPMILSLVCVLALVCSESLRRKSPHNLMVLGIFTVFEAWTVGGVTAAFEVHEVLMAIGITAVVCLALTLYAFQTKYDFTGMGAALFTCLITLMIFGIVAMFIPDKIVSLVYSSLGALLFSFYLIYDTQLMLGGNHKYSISPEEYVFAALSLYLDVLNLFLYILRIIGDSR